MSSQYRAIAEPGCAQTRVLGSRFLGTAVRANDAEEAMQLLEHEKRERHDATHWCYAVRHGFGAETVEKSSDAGEPHGTAGIPILREIQKRDLTNCLVIVTRYFGGTKLGTGNLARAYAECAALALDASVVGIHEITVTVFVECGYDDQAVVYHVARRFQADVELLPSSLRVEFRLRFAPENVAAAMTALQEESCGRIVVSESPS